MMLTENEIEQDTIATINIPAQTLISDTHPIDSSRSSQINDLYAALALAQAEMEIAAERKYKAARGGYPRMADLIIASRKYLAAHGLSIHQKIYTDDQSRDFLRTELAHKSGQWTSSTIRYDWPKGDLDAWQSFIDKMKREAYKAITGCVSDEDDDGMAAQDELYRKKDKGIEPNIVYKPKDKTSDFITTEQVKLLQREATKYPELVEQIYNRWKIKSLADLRKSEFEETLDYLRDTTQKRDGLREQNRTI